MIAHPIYRVLSYEIIGPYTVRIQFDDRSWQTINFEPLLRGVVYGPLRDLALFNQVRLDSETHTLVWPNGADFDPATLHDWPEQIEELRRLAQRWESHTTEPARSDAHGSDRVEKT